MENLYRLSIPKKKESLVTNLKNISYYKLSFLICSSVFTQILYSNTKLNIKFQIKFLEDL
jgi:hypothetical protein